MNPKGRTPKHPRRAAVFLTLRDTQVLTKLIEARLLLCEGTSLNSNRQMLRLHDKLVRAQRRIGGVA